MALVTPDLAEMLTWLRQQIEGDKAAALKTLDTKDRIALQRRLPIPRWRFVEDGQIRGTDNTLRVKFTWPYEADHIVRHDPADVIADCDAKLAIIARCKLLMNEPDEYPNGLVSPRATLARMTLADLLGAYRHRDGYKQTWTS